MASSLLLPQQETTYRARLSQATNTATVAKAAKVRLVRSIEVYQYGLGNHRKR
jgi:hypothetical protein